MSDVVKLTAYFAERERTDGAFLAERMLDLFDSHDVPMSVMLRGIASFGPRNIVRTDESLSMSEDLPVALAAVDSPQRIDDMVDDVVAMTGRGLITLERAKLATGGAAAGDGHEATKVTVYAGRHHRIDGTAAQYPVCDLFHRLGFYGAVTFLGVDGVVTGQRRRAQFFSRNTEVPLMVIGIGSAEQAAAATTELSRLIPSALLTTERIQVCKRDGELHGRPPVIPAADESGLQLFQKLTVHTSEATRHDGAPIHRALIRRLRESRHAAGATVLRGIWGFHGDHPPHGDAFFQYGRRVPATTTIVDTPEAIAASFDIVDELTGQHGLVTSEMVPAVLALDSGNRGGGTRLARHLF